MRLRTHTGLLAAIVCVAALSSCSAASLLSATPLPTPSPSPAATATQPPLPTATPAPTCAPCPSPLPTDTPAPTPTATPWPTPDGAPRTAYVPILMYHHISVPPRNADAIRRDLSVSPENFEQQLRYLKDNGYQTIRLYDLNRHLQRGDPLPQKPVILTFDDGYRDNFDYAFPLLVKYGFTGTFFLVTEPIDRGDEAHLTWAQVTVMSRMGMDMEPHTYTHADLTNKPLDYIVWQVIGSKEAIEERTGKACRFFAYPSGQYDQAVVDVLKSAYFWGAVVSQGGATHSSDGMFHLKRVRIRGSDCLEQFAQKLTLDW